MDGDRFDTLTRVVGAAGTRRSLGSLVGVLLGLLALTRPGSQHDTVARKRKQVKIEGPCGNGSGKANRCKRNRQCCTGYCQKRKRKKNRGKNKVQGRCRCRKPGQSCSADRNCCPQRTGRICFEGTCQPAICADRCPDGCCAGDTCLPGTSTDACGTGGGTCQPCETGEVCWQGACVCGDVCAGGDCQFTSIQQAISQAASGATIRICRGVYQEGRTIKIDRSVTLIGAGQGESGTVLDGEDAHIVVEVGYMIPGVVLDGLRIVNGGNSTHGGGVYNEGGVELIDCTIAQCEAYHGGGIFNAGYVADGVTLTGSTVTDNQAEYGAGVYNDRSDLTLNGSTIRGNTATESGGGIFRGAESGAITFTDSTVCGNSPDQCFEFTDLACVDICPGG